MPAKLGVGVEVSSTASKYARQLDLEPGKKRRKRERKQGVILRSAPGGKWRVLWADLIQEDCSPAVLKFEGPATDDTMVVVRSQESIDSMSSGERVSTDREESSISLGNIPVDHLEVEELSNGVVALRPVPPLPPVAAVPPPVPAPVPPEAAMTTVLTTVEPVETEVQESNTEDERPPIGSGYVYDDQVLNELLSDRYGTRRAEIEVIKNNMVGETVNVGGRIWTVREDIKDDDENHSEFAECGLRSDNLLLRCLPKRFCTRTETMAGRRASPRIAKADLDQRDEGAAMCEYFKTLYPVPWKQSFKRLNDAITLCNTSKRTKQRIKILDESMSPFRPQTTKTGNLPHLSFIFRTRN